ncbi:enhanced intracellular survival protein Eis [Bacillus songklensis]|uniref:Enhanced intracellular survival protein Eis n=1 Tax=Bacillus songklensis TaxID=1069116 RepID=A0ABV8B4L8_9BACI
MTLRQIAGEEGYEDTLKLSQYAFQYTLTEEEREKKKRSLARQQIWAIYDDQNQLESKLHILPHKVWIEGQSIPMGGIAGVATWPEHRRNGNVATLVKHALQQMKEDGYVISYLHPFKVSFYRKYGWELIADRHTYELSKDDLVMFPSINGRIKRMDIEREWNILNDTYEAFSAHYNGMLKRDKFWWLHHVNNPGYHFAAAFGDQDEMIGYLMYKIHFFYQLHKLIKKDR